MLAGVGIEFSVAVATKWIDISIVKTLLETAGFGMKEIAIVVGIIIVGIMVYTVLYIFVGTDVYKRQGYCCFIHFYIRNSF